MGGGGGCVAFTAAKAPRRAAGHTTRAAVQQARRAKERTYPEFARASRTRLVLALQICGRWSSEAASFIRLHARARRNSRRRFAIPQRVACRLHCRPAICQQHATTAIACLKRWLGLGFALGPRRLTAERPANKYQARTSRSLGTTCKGCTANGQSAFSTPPFGMFRSSQCIFWHRAEIPANSWHLVDAI